MLRKHLPELTGGILLIALGLIILPPSKTLAGIIQAIIPAVVPTSLFQGSGATAKFQGGIGAFTNGHLLQYDASGNAIDSGAVPGGQGTAGSTLFSSTTQAGPSNTAAQTSLIGTVTGSTTILANTFTNGAVLEVRAQGYYSLPAVADSFTVRVKCGSTVLGSAAFTPAAGVVTNGTFRLWLMITGIGSGASGAFMTNGMVSLVGSSLSPAEAAVLNTSNVAFDFTTACAMDVTAQWGAGQAGESITGTNVAAWVPGAPVTSVNGATGAIVTGGVMGLCASAGASTTTYTCNLSPNNLQAYVTGQRYTFQPDVTNTAASTVNINGLGAKAIVMYDGSTALIAADLAAGGFYDLEYNGTSMVKMNGPPTAWTGFSYSNGWGDFGSSFQTGQYHKDNWGNVTLRGVLADGTQTSGTVIFTLPAGFRPVTANGTIISCLQGNSGITRINVTQSGQVSLGSTVTGTFVSVEGTQFNADF
jgi:hypothetical protein